MARLGKRERALKRKLLAIAEAQNTSTGGHVDGLVSMTAGDYGRSCANVNPFNVQGRGRVDWSHNGRRNKHGKAYNVKS